MAPVFDTQPDGHVTHRPEDMYSPPRQASHIVEPSLRLVLPVSHLLHLTARSVSANRPALHGAQASEEVAPKDAELVPGGQALHKSWRDAPCAEEYVPAGHLRQTEALDAAEVLLQKPSGHKAHSVLPAFATVPASHSVQLEPGTVLTLPS